MLADTKQRVEQMFDLHYTIEGARRLIRRLGFSHSSPRQFHPKANLQDQKAFRNEFLRLAKAAIPGDMPIESVLVYFQDEARIGQKGMLSRVWVRKGTRARIPCDHRYGYVYLFSAACPETGAVVGHACPKANTEEMSRHLRDIGEQVPDGKPALVVLDGAGWHRSKELNIPANVSLLRLPPYSPELNPIETLFSVLKHRHFANRVFENAEHVRKVVEKVWEDFAGRTEEVMRITRRDWAIIRTPAPILSVIT